MKNHNINKEAELEGAMLADWVNILIRSVILVFMLFILTKWLGKKHLSQLSIFDYINGFVLGGIVAIIAVDVDANFYHGVLAMLVWFLIPFSIEYIALKSKVFRNFVQGKSTVVIQDGKIMEENLKKEGFSTDDLLQHLREDNVFQVADVEFALIEPTGRLSVLLKSEHQPLTAKTANIHIAPKKEPQTVIMDGKLLLEPLANLQLNPAWLRAELDKQNVLIENVFLGQVDSDGQVTIDLYEDQLKVPNPTEKPLLLATLKKCEADLQLFTLATENEQSKKLYERNSIKLQEVITLVETYLR